MFLPAFPSGTNLKLPSTFISPKLFKISHNGSWTSLVDPVFILFQLRFSRIYQLIFPIYVWKNFDFQIVWKSHTWSLPSKIAQDHCTVSIFSTYRDSCDKLLHNNFVEHLEKCGSFFLIFSNVLFTWGSLSNSSW